MSVILFMLFMEDCREPGGNSMMPDVRHRTPSCYCAVVSESWAGSSECCRGSAEDGEKNCLMKKWSSLLYLSNFSVWRWRLAVKGGDRSESGAALCCAIGRLRRAGRGGGGACGRWGGGRSGDGGAFRLLCFCLGLFVHRATQSGHKKLRIDHKEKV